MKDIRICFLGESFINGTGDNNHLGWTGRVCVNLSQQGHKITYYNLGIRRETSRELAHRWQSEVKRRFCLGCQPLVVFSFGTNDTTQQNGRLRVELNESLKNARNILAVAKQNYPVFMISPPPILDDEQNSRTQVLSQHFTELCQELEIPYLDVFTPLLNSSTWMQEIEAGDGAHPDSEGYAELAFLVQNWSAWVDWFKLF